MIKGGSVEQLRSACAALPACKAFNSNGWLKSGTWPRAASDADLYIKGAASPPDAHSVGVGPGKAAPGPSSARVTAEQVLGISPELQAEYAHMREQLKIFVYPLETGKDMAAPVDYKYGAEGAFVSRLRQSAHMTEDPAQAMLFYLPARCTAYRYAAADRAAGQRLAEETTLALLREAVQRWPHWNATRGADHFYVCAHDMGVSVASGTGLASSVDQQPLLAELRKNAVAVVNTADYGDAYYTPHKDIALPPNVGDGCARCIQGGHELVAPEAGGGEALSTRRTLAFFAGNMARGRVRPKLLELWRKDPDFVLHDGYLGPAAYLEGLRGSQFCLFLRGHRAWSPRLMDAVWAGCVPVIISDHYDLPLQGLVDWRRMSVIVPESSVARLKDLLLLQRAKLPQLRAALQRSAHFLTWHHPPQPYDAFESVLLQLWRRRFVTRFA
jgi:hypothetical protein